MNQESNNLDWVADADPLSQMSNATRRSRWRTMEGGETMEDLSRSNPCQISARRIDYSGVLADFAASLWGGGVRIYGFSGTTGNGIIEIRLVVEPPELAREILREQGWYIPGEQKPVEVVSVNAEARL